jgi:hypothetical protein
MITKDTHKIDWNKTAQVSGVVLMALAKGAWWLTRRASIFLFAFLTVLVKVFVSVISVWASLPDNSHHDRHDLGRVIDPDNPDHDVMGRPINIHRNHF